MDDTMFAKSMCSVTCSECGKEVEWYKITKNTMEGKCECSSWRLEQKPLPMEES